MDDILRKRVKLLKALQGISYAEIAEYLEVKRKSFYAWLKGEYNFSQQKIEQLKNILDTVEE